MAKLMRGVLLLACASCAPPTDTAAKGAGFTHPSGTISGNVTWPMGTHYVQGTQTLSSGSLTVPAGSTLLMSQGSSIVVGKNAALHLAGSAAQRVSVTSAASAPNRGDWGLITFQTGCSADSSIAFADIAYGGNGFASGTDQVGMVTIEAGTTVALSSSTVENSSNFGIAVNGDATLPGFSGNSLLHNKLGAIALSANDAGQLLDGTFAPNDVAGIAVLASPVSQSATWRALGTPYLLQAINIQTLTGQAVLTVAAGATLLMGANQSLLVGHNGGLNLAGTAASPITVSSQGNPANRGDWGRIAFAVDSLASENAINYTSLSYGGGAGYSASGSQSGTLWLDSGATVTVTNSTVSNSASEGIFVTKGGVLSAFAGNTLINNATSPLTIDVDSVAQLNLFTNTYSADGVLVTGSALLHSATWSPLGAPYVVANAFYIDTGGAAGFTTLTLAAGTTLQLKQNAAISVHPQGQLVANGTASQRVTITANNQFQDWNFLELLSSGTCTLKSVTLSYGGANSVGQVAFKGGTINLTDLQMPVHSSSSTCDYTLCPQATVNGSPPGSACQNPQC